MQGEVKSDRPVADGDRMSRAGDLGERSFETRNEGADRRYPARVHAFQDISALVARQVGTIHRNNRARFGPTGNDRRRSHASSKVSKPDNESSGATARAAAGSVGLRPKEARVRPSAMLA